MRLIFSAPAVGVAGLVVGCANPGPPQPPSLRLPAPAKNLQAQRVGDHVVLSWTTPYETTDGQAVRLPLTAVICLETIATPTTRAGQRRPAPHQALCVPVQRQTVSPGATSIMQKLPESLLADPPQLLAYRVELQNAKGKFAPAPAPAYAASGAAPPAAGGIHGIPTRAGAAIEWVPQASAAAMELHRTLIADLNAPAPKPTKETAFGSKKAETAEVTLRAKTVEAKDMGGLLDATATPPHTYAYVAQRVRTVTLGSHTLEVRGEPSPAIVFVDHDVFPPRAPVGVTSIASAGLNGPASIDLSWEPNDEVDLLGYNVYRSDSADGPFRRLTAEPVAGPAYRDLTAKPGHAYAYAVTAVDEHGNESERGVSVHETIPTGAPGGVGPRE